ncbi:MAG TPA: glutamyl-tRNA reductase [Gemmatimonadaceae bacterium]|nr:glutamyl-tRNA reductase [Gemmatimonadaceae bacterium]
MALILAGLSHHTAPIDVREKVAISSHETPRVLEELAQITRARELALLSTCNRTEVYVVEGDAPAAPGIWAHLSRRLGGSADAASYGYVRRDREAAAHLYRVASGLDSMILGEAQIHGQVRDAWEASRSTSRAILNRLFQSSLLVASRIRTETAVGRGAASVSSAAVQLAKKIFGSLSGRRAMVLGAGDMADIALECLVSEGVRTAVVANRTHERAVSLVERHGGEALRYEECWPRLADVDVLLCSTAAPHPIVERAQVEPAMRQRGDRPLCILDIALPRDVAADVGTLDNVFLYDLDDLRSVVANNIERRRQELPSAESVIAEEVELYWQWLAGLAAVPVLRTFRSRMDRVREDELAHALKKLAHLPADDRAAVDLFSRALMNKFLHEPSVRLRAASANGHGLAIVDALRYLFGLEPSDSEAPSDDAPNVESR